MSWYPTHTDEEVLGATVGGSGPTGSAVGAVGAAGVAGPTGVTGATGASGTGVENLYMNDYGPSGNLTITDNTVRLLGLSLRSQGQLDQGFGSSIDTERNEYGGDSTFTCRKTGDYRVSFCVRARQSTTTDRAGLMRITWGRYNTTSPRDVVMLEQYGGCLSDGGGDVSICGLWVGTLLNGERYGLWNDTAGTGTLRRPTSQNSTLLVEWIRESVG